MTPTSKRHFLVLRKKHSVGTLKIQGRGSNENVKIKRFTINKQNNNFVRASHFFANFFAFLHDHDMKMAYFAFYGEGKQATERRNFISLSELRYGP